MPKRNDIHKVLVIGSGPIVIGQAAEFDYAGTQACLALKEEGYEVILANSNPATIMTDHAIADKVYMEPLTLEYLARICRYERPDAIIPGLGGQTGLNLAMQLEEKGVLKECEIEMLGTDAASIRRAEDRELFKELCEELGEPVVPSCITTSVEASLGHFVVLLLIQIFSCLLVWVYCENQAKALRLLAGCLGVSLLALLFSLYVIPFDITYVEVAVCVALMGYLLWQWLATRIRNYLWITLFALGSLVFFNAADYVLNHMMEPHQRVRINVLLGLEEDLKGAGYNVHQSEIAIGSGGLEGKGFLNGTQTKLKFVPEQDTDFIFCTVGEEEGFLGSACVLLLFLALILRLIHLAERQYHPFGRIYGYCVLSIFLFHVFINVGMVLGLTPVIGIPLPFFSYGGSSLWGFTLLLFIFLRIDAGRNLVRT